MINLLRGEFDFRPYRKLLHHDHAHGKVKNKLSSSSSTINRFMTQSTHSQPALILYEVQGYCYRFAKKAQSEINEDPVLYI